jgi:hypothetical protein
MSRTGRTEAFSDGVLAVAATGLLVYALLAVFYAFLSVVERS